MPMIAKPFGVALLALIASTFPAFANEASDLAHELKLPIPVVDSVLKHIDQFFAAQEGPSNRLMTGVVKDITLKAVKDRFSSLEDSGPGKSSEASAGDRNASYHAGVRTTRRESAENRECVDNHVTVTASEAPPIVSKGGFILDTLHPKVTSTSWTMSFCRTPINGGADYSEWQLTPAK